MAVATTYAFTLDLVDVIEDAYRKCGLELRTGDDFQMARKALDLMLIEWQNRGINFWTVAPATLALVAGTATYALPADTIDIIEQTIRTGSGSSQVDIPITRVNVSTYSSTPNKNATGRPTRVFVDKQRDAVSVTLWPVPDTSSYTFAYYRLRMILDSEGASEGATNPDVPKRFLPVLVSGLAYEIACRKPQTLQIRPELKMKYEEQWGYAVAGDRSRSNARLVPRISRV